MTDIPKQKETQNHAIKNKENNTNNTTQPSPTSIAHVHQLEDFPEHQRIVFHSDAIEFLNKNYENKFPDNTIVFTSLPDFSEYKQDLKIWKHWFIDTIKLILNKQK